MRLVSYREWLELRARTATACVTARGLCADARALRSLGQEVRVVGDDRRRERPRGDETGGGSTGPVLVDVGARDLVELTWDESQQLVATLAVVTNGFDLAREFGAAGAWRPVDAAAVGTLDSMLATIGFWRHDVGSLPLGIERLYDTGLAVQHLRRRPLTPV